MVHDQLGIALDKFACTTLHIFFFNDTATTEIYTLSLHDALPIYLSGFLLRPGFGAELDDWRIQQLWRSEEHTSELQSHVNLVCRLLLEKNKSLAAVDPAVFAGRRSVRVARAAGRHAGAAGRGAVR